MAKGKKGKKDKGVKGDFGLKANSDSLKSEDARKRQMEENRKKQQVFPSDQGNA